MIKILKHSDEINNSIFSRDVKNADVSGIVSEIIEKVKKEGDKALFYYAEKFDNAKLTSLEVSKEEIDKAYNECEAEFIDILNTAAENIRAFHKNQIRSGFIENERNGVVLGQKIVPLKRAGIYIPGGTAAYPSSVLMNCIPAKLAGVGEVIMVTPPTGGRVNPIILAAAKVAGVDRVFAAGGAQAVAALAYGTESVPSVDKISGPGNAFVAEAKSQVSGIVGIDMIAGPSEILVIADETANPAWVAADLLSQAEHDKMASAVLVTNSEALAKKVSDELEVQIPLLQREEIARTSIENNGKIIIVENIEKAIEISNDIAPEHLEICLDNPFDYLDRITNAGSVFLGKNCPEALGDYYSGTNHTLPTSGTAKFSSPLSVDDFVKKIQYSYYSYDALSKVCDEVAYFADKEGLGAHKRSVTIRFDK